MAVVAVRPFVDGKRGGCLNPEEINSRSPRWRTRRLGWPRLALTREKGFGRISKRATSIGAHYTRGDHEKNHPPRSTGALSGREGGAPTPPPARIKKRTRSLIISVEGQESAKRRSSAWRAARKSAPRHTAWILGGALSSTALSIRLSLPSLFLLGTHPLFLSHSLSTLSCGRFVLNGRLRVQVQFSGNCRMALMTQSAKDRRVRARDLCRVSIYKLVSYIQMCFSEVPLTEMLRVHEILYIPRKNWISSILSKRCKKERRKFRQSRASVWMGQRKSTPEIGSSEVERTSPLRYRWFDEEDPARWCSGRNLERAKNPCRAQGGREGGRRGGSRRLRPWKEVVAIHGRKEAQILGLALPVHGTEESGLSVR